MLKRKQHSVIFTIFAKQSYRKATTDRWRAGTTMWTTI